MRVVMCAILALVIAGCLALGRREALYDPDVLFVLEASQYLNAATTLSEAASERSLNPQVQRFAAQVAQSHRDAREELRGIGLQQALSIPTKMEPLARLSARGIENLPVDQFDREYLLRMFADTSRMALLLAKRNSHTRNPQLAAWERTQLPLLRGYSATAERLLEQPGPGEHSKMNCGENLPCGAAGP